MNIPTLEEIAPYVARKLVRQDRRGSLVLSNYTQRCQYDGEWDRVTTQCRGLIIDEKTGEPVALAFPKFFNHGAPNCTTPDGLPSAVTIKRDGVLGVLYREGPEATTRWATRGSFGSPQSVVANRLWSDVYGSPPLPDSWTLMAEIISPECRILINYGDEERLEVLAARDRWTGVYISRAALEDWCDFAGLPIVDRVPVASAGTFRERANALPESEEGWVLEWQDGHRVKVKGAAYFALARLATGFSEAGVVKAWAKRDMDSLAALPEEFRAEADAWVAPWAAREAEAIAEVERLVSSVQHLARRDAVWTIGTTHPLFGCVMRALNGADFDTRPALYKAHKREVTP